MPKITYKVRRLTNHSMDLIGISHSNQEKSRDVEKQFNKDGGTAIR